MVSLEPPATVATRLEGTRRTYRLDIESVYHLAVQAYVDQVERRARQIRKTDPLVRSMPQASSEGAQAARRRAQTLKEPATKICLNGAFQVS